MLKKLIVIFVTNVCLVGSLFAQKNEHKFPDFTYQSDIRSVHFYRQGHELSYPVMELNSNDKLELRFDELGGRVNTYYYTLIHCDAGWKPSNIHYTEYLTGFDNDQIRDYATSFNTRHDYVHYRVEIPNENMSLKVSGNYILLVYKDFDQSQPVLSRRFYVFEPVVKLQSSVMRPKFTQFRNIGQVVDFSINHQGLTVNDPYSDVKVHILQNFRMDNAITTLKPRFVNHNLLDYSYDQENMFAGGNEFRYFDIKSMRYQAEFIELIRFENPYFHVWLAPSEDRYRKPYYFVNELNGRFYIDIQEGRDKHIEADYVYVHFRLPAEAPVVEGDVYVFGGFTDWHYQERAKMTYNFHDGMYELTMQLKQGYYNFIYTYLKEDALSAEPDYFEGSHYETENDYYIFVYHSDFTSRYDRLVGYSRFNSLSQGARQ